MAFIRSKELGPKIGDYVILNREFSSMIGTFEKGTRVKITNCVPMRGYSVIDDEGNSMCEMGFDIGEVVE